MVTRRIASAADPIAHGIDLGAARPTAYREARKRRVAQSDFPVGLRS
jgi:hypothetical protein